MRLKTSPLPGKRKQEAARLSPSPSLDRIKLFLYIFEACCLPIWFCSLCCNENFQQLAVQTVVDKIFLVLPIVLRGISNFFIGEIAYPDWVVVGELPLLVLVDVVDSVPVCVFFLVPSLIKNFSIDCTPLTCLSAMVMFSPRIWPEKFAFC